MKTRKNGRKLTRLILAALMATGGGLWSSSAEATEYTWNGALTVGEIAHVGAIDYLNPTYGYNTLNLTTPGSSNYVAGGWRNDATALTGLTVNVNGGFWAGVYGAFADSSSTGIVSRNTVTVNNGGIIQKVICGGVSKGSGNVEKNIVNIKGGEVGYKSDHTEESGAEIRGGYIEGGSGNAIGNEVNIESGKVNAAVYGAFADNLSGGNVTDNHVTITGGTIKGEIIGGKSSSGNATGNVVTISGGSITGMVTGGMSINGNAIDNTVNVLPLTSMTLTGINGGTGSGAGDTGNTINFASKDITITDNIYAVQNLNFYLPKGIAANDTMVTVNGGATYLDGVTIGAAALKGVSLSKGDSVTLLKNANGFTGTAATTTLTTPPKATSLAVNKSYKFTISQNDEDITATVADVNAGENEQAKSLVETRAATTTFINAGADMLSSQGFAQAANAVALEAAENAKNGAPGVQNVGGFTPFAAFGGSGLRAESGSYVNTKGFGLNVGFARELPNAQGKLLFGPVVEYGGGSYDSHLDDGTRGDGKAHYFGVGVMARQVNHDGFYYEGSLRGGRVTSDYDGNLDGVGKVDYDSSSNYFAAHLGVGKAFDLGKGNTLDGYFKYFYSHQAGDDTTIHIAGMDDERGHFDAVDSHRIRIGARLTHKVNERNSFYGGLAYQYEFNGDARATFSGNGVPSPSLKGSSGLLELGWQVKPGEGPLKLDLGVTGWAGRQRGGSVQLGATWSF